MKKWGSFIRYVALLCCFFAAACTRQAARPAVSPAADQPGAASITIETVEVKQEANVRLSGTASLPSGSCLQTGLWIDDQPADWWPSDICIEPDAGAWEMVVALGIDDTPARLNPQARYEVRTWRQGEPDIILARHHLSISE